MEQREKSSVTRLYHAGNWVVRIIGSMIFLALGWYSMKYTYYVEPGDWEWPTNVADSVGRNLLALAAALAVFAALSAAERRISRRAQLFWKRASLCAVLLWVGGASAWWILAGDRIPVADQAHIYGGASYFMEGDFGFLNKGAYLGMHPHQLALVALCELFFRFVGAYNYKAIEAVCGILAVGAVFVGYLLVSEISDRMSVIVGYNLLMLGCLPLIFYTPWCYGDIPSIFFALIVAWALLRYAKQGRVRYLVLLVGAMTLALLFRKHSLILLTAFCIVAVLYALRKKDRRILLAALAAVVMFEASYQGIYKMYEVRSGIEHEEGIPFVAWVAMGMQESTGYYFGGWFNNYPKAIYGQMDLDEEMVVDASLQNLKERFIAFGKEPKHAVEFFREKILSQWNQPLYESIFFNTNYNGEAPAPNSVAEGVSGIHFESYLHFCDRWQFVIFLGMLCYYLFAVKKDSPILQHLLAVTIIGGFFFSILYEAKARYIFPYYVMMFPYAAYGYCLLQEAVVSLIGRWRNKRHEVEPEWSEKRRTA